MANGIAINGIVQPMGFGLGSVATLVGGQIPTQYAGAIMRVKGGNAARAMCSGGRNELVPRVGASPVMPGLTCDMAGGMACARGTPQSALAGFGAVSNWTCSDWAAIMTQMQSLLARAEEQGMSTAEYNTARNYFDNNTGPFQKPIFTCASATVEAQRIYNDLNRVVGGGTSVSEILSDNTGSGSSGSSGSLASAAKWGAIALVAIAGAYTLGPIFRGIGGLIPARKK